MRELLAAIEKRAKKAENKATQVEMLSREQERRNTEISSEVEVLKAALAKKAEELTEEVATAKADKAI